MLPLIAVTALGLAAADDLLSMLGEGIRVTIEWDDAKDLGYDFGGYRVSIYVGVNQVGYGCYVEEPEVSEQNPLQSAAEAINDAEHSTKMYTSSEITKAVATQIRDQRILHWTIPEIERSLRVRLDPEP